MALINVGNVHTIFSPTKVIFGNGSAHNIAQEVRQLGGKKVFIVTDPEIERVDLLKPIKESLRASAISFSIFDRVKPEPSSWIVDEVAQECRSENFESPSWQGPRPRPRLLI